jgi:hypothetical protein
MGAAMKTFISVCTAGVAAGILTAAAATNVPARRDLPANEINRAGKTDRLVRPAAGTIVVRTISIPVRKPAEAERALSACESLVSPLADRLASRRARQCAT